MKFKLPWANKDIPAKTETKGFTIPPYMTLAGMLEDAGCYDLSFFILNKYYKMCAPLGDAVDTIAQGVSDIQPQMWDKKKKKFVDHPILELIEYPNTSQSREDFMKELSGVESINQNVFLEFIGRENKPPISMETRSPVHSTLMPNSVGDLGTILIRTTYINDMYKAKIIDKRTRYRNGNGKEIWPILGFNTDKGSNRFYGIPRIQSLYYDIEQYIMSGRHNAALLKNGARPSGVMTSKQPDPLTDDQYTRMQDQLNRYYAGPDNAGKVMLAEWFEYKSMIVSNRDMDFPELRAGVKEMIYLRYGIPLPLVTTGAMTFNNYGTSRVAEYQNAIIPQTKYLLSQIWNAVGYRYNPNDWRNYELTIDETKIDALETVKTESIKLRSQVGVNTINELRVALGDDEKPGLDDIYRPANEIPIMDGDDEDTEPDEDETEEETEKRLRNAVNARGDRRR